jgi:enolase
MEIACDVYHCLRGIIKEAHGATGTNLGDEGGFVPPIDNVKERLDLIKKAIIETGNGGKVSMGLDCAASEFFRSGTYHIGKKSFSSKALVDFYEDLAGEYDIISIEDGMHEEDWSGWGLLSERLGNTIQIVGDDLFVTNPDRIRKGISGLSANSIILKVNQIGTITESLEAARITIEQGWSVVVSHRSGETEDTFISDLVVGLDAGQSKFGAPARTDRTAKYNQLLRIEKELGDQATYARFPFH